MRFTLVLLAVLAAACPVVAQQSESTRARERERNSDRLITDDSRSPNQMTLRGDVIRPRLAPRPRIPRPSSGNPARFPDELRSYDGTGNNLRHYEWGATGIPFSRITSVDYSDGSESPAGRDRPNARRLSSACADQRRPFPSSLGVTDFVWQWGQFLDHDLDLTPEMDPVEAFDIVVPSGDSWFDPGATGEARIPLGRSFYLMVDGVRQQINQITAYIDGSNVYGSDPERAAALRTLDGTGRLRTGPGDLLPFNDVGLPNAPSSDAGYYLAGDFRANEQVGLTAMHTLFVREHNYWADLVAREQPGLDGEAIYQTARAIVIAELQQITYDEFLPVLLGPLALRSYEGYDEGVNPGITNLFATAAFRFGHSMLSGRLLRLDVRGEPTAAGPLSLASAFFDPDLLQRDGIEPYLRGLAHQTAQEIDNRVVDGVRNFLFGHPGAGGFDLAALNIQRGRDHGLPGYNRVRIDLGLEPHRTFAVVNPDPDVARALAEVYDSPWEVDAWVGGLAEQHLPGALIGETWSVVLRDQFERLRDGDRFWYSAYLPKELLERIEDQTLARIIRRNTRIGTEIQDDVFRKRGQPSLSSSSSELSPVR